MFQGRRDVVASLPTVTNLCLTSVKSLDFNSLLSISQWQIGFASTQPLEAADPELGIGKGGGLLCSQWLKAFA